MSGAGGGGELADAAVDMAYSVLAWYPGGTTIRRNTKYQKTADVMILIYIM